MSFFNIDGFKSALVGGGARANQFRVQLNYPSSANPGAEAFQGPRAEFLVTAAALPGSVVNPTIVPYRGREVKFAGERTFAPWTITVLNDVSFTIRNNLERWMNSMNGLSDNQGTTSHYQYQTDLSVYQLGRNGEVLKTYLLVGAFPTDISEIALNFGDNDTVETFTCTFQYQHYITEFNSNLATALLGG